MKQRVITAVIACLIFIPVLFAGGLYIDWLAALLAAVGISEIFLMKKQIIVSVEFLIALLATFTWTVPDSFLNGIPMTKFGFYFAMIMLLLTWMVLSKNRTNFESVGIYTLSSLYIGTGFHYLAAIRNKSGLVMIGLAFAIIWSTDIGAYMVGKAIGKNKLWPEISPNKTWEGSIGAVVVAMIVAVIYASIFHMKFTMVQTAGIAFLLSIVGQVGDLVESAYKRYWGVKDSGKILPGHGGILDRFDSTLFVLPVFAAILGFTII
ncbi:MAG: phosphatidate cytidylyltransferase [Lactobacillus sp.]|nr:phosphatidate cytidylyltransferase [Lactobacillus sp.]